MCSQYCFPYNAYDIQIELMDSVYYALENNKIAIIESPTGTGKSLSLICATTQWLKHFKTNRFNDLTKQLSKLNDEIKTIETETQLSSDWISLQNKKSILCQKRDLSIKELDKIQTFNKRNDSLIDRKNNTFMRKKFALSHKSLTKKLKTENDLNNDLTSDDNQLDEDLVNYCSDEEVIDETNETKEEDKMVRPKIYYCSRTHSQLSQFISEIKKTSFASEETPLRTVPLGSRVNLCVNPNVIKLNNINLINEKCIELQNSKNKCQMHKQGFINELKDEVLTDVQDIEEITQLGKRVKACPYYSTRLAIPEAEIVILPYNILLHSGTRQSFGIDLKESVVIIDEAHNLIETINNIHSIEIKGSHIIDSQTQLNQYLTKYYSRLSPKNIMHIKQIIYILNEFIKHLKVGLNDKTNDNTSHVYEGLNFLIKLGIENLNLFKILDFCEKSRIARKLYGFNEKQKRFQVENNSENSSKKLLSGTTAFLAKMKGKTIEIESNPSNSSNDEDIQTYGSPLYLIKEFLRALINTNTSGRIITNIDKNSMRKCSLKYILLNPGSHFKEIVSECRSVILCGGTMQPFDEYMDHLFRPLGISSERLHTFSCGHVIPDSNLLTVALGVGPNQIKLNYTFQNRNNSSLIEETGRTIANLCQVIPGGVVCFFPSYDYENLLFTHWSKSGLLKSIESKGKRVFREPKQSNLVQSTLADYSRSIGSVNSKKGALLMCVVGGKMSEGINFSDDLGRGVIVVGLPYANKNSIELQEKLKYLNNMKPDSGNVYYENLCMKAVNQSIGRAIRHKNDYAVIVLLDNRYTSRQNIKESLPKWIRSRLMCFDKFPQAFGSVRQFFSNK